MKPYFWILVVSVILASSSGSVGWTQADGMPVIDQENAHRVTQLAMLGRGWTKHLAWSSDGETIAVGSSVGVWLYDSKELNREPYLLTDNMVQSMAFSPVGPILAVGGWNLDVWNTRTLNKLFHLEGHTNRVTSLAYSPDGSLLASGSSDGTVRLWNTTTGENTAVLHNPANETIWEVSFISNKTILALSRTLLMWDITTKEYQTLEARSDVVARISSGFDGVSLAVGMADGTIHLGDVQNPTVQRVLEGHAGGIRDIQYSPDGIRLASGDSNGIVHLWDPVTGAVVATFEGHTKPILGLAFSPNGKRLATTGSDNIVRVWEIVTGKSVTLDGYMGSIGSVTFSPDGALVAAGDEEGNVRLWILATGESRIVFTGAGIVLDVAFSPDGTRLAVAGHQLRVLKWDETTNEWQIILEKYPYTSIAYVEFSPDGSVLAVGKWGYTVVHLLDALTGEELAVLEGLPNALSGVAFSADGTRLAAGSIDGSVLIWNTETTEVLHRVRSEDIRVESVDWSPDGITLAAGTWNGSIQLWSTETGMSLAVWGNMKGTAITSVTFSPNAALLASTNSSVSLWDVATGERLTRLAESNYQVADVTFNKDGTLLASGSTDGTLRLWGVPSKTE
jgi:WD40 repeat protein